MRGQLIPEDTYMIRWSSRLRFSLVKACRALLIVFGCSVAGGYAAGSFFLPSHAAVAPQSPVVRRYIAVETPVPQPVVLSGTFPAQAREAGSIAPAPWLAVAPSAGRPAVPFSPSTLPSGIRSPMGTSAAARAAGPTAFGPRFYVEVSVCPRAPDKPTQWPRIFGGMASPLIRVVRGLAYGWGDRSTAPRPSLSSPSSPPPDSTRPWLPISRLARQA